MVVCLLLHVLRCPSNCFRIGSIVIVGSTLPLNCRGCSNSSLLVILVSRASCCISVAIRRLSDAFDHFSLLYPRSRLLVYCIFNSISILIFQAEKIQLGVLGFWGFGDLGTLGL